MITPKYLLHNVEKYGNEAALSVKDKNGNWTTETWKDLYQNIQNIAKALIACKVEIGEKISIYSYNRPEWYSCYAATQFINSVAVGIYHTCSSAEVEWIISNSDSKIIFVGNTKFRTPASNKLPYVPSFI